jgi:citrate lyase beta subunit
MSQNANPKRSLLFVPGARLEILPKGEASRTYISCIALEDPVADDAKDAVRAEAITAVADYTSQDKTEIWLRINSIRSTEGMADIIALAESDTAPDG